MKDIVIFCLVLLTPLITTAQWATNGSDISNTNVGNVGVGTTSPSAKLDIVGNINLSSGGQYNIGGVRMLSANGTQNLFLGSASGNAVTSGQRNALFGFQSGPALTTGSNNAFIGYRTGFVNNSGGNNIFIGSQTGYSNTTGSFNGFFGTNAGYSNTTADYGLMLGYFAGYSNTTGTHNAFIGYQAGYTNQTGNYNVALGSRAGYKGTGSYNAYIGYQAGRETTTGENNAYFGNRAGYLSTTGGNNTFIGNSAGDNNTSGSQNTYIGSNAKGTALLTNATAIGANASVTASNSMVLGSGANVGIGISAPTQTLHVAGNARITGSIFDSNNEAGTTAQVLSSTGIGTDWVSLVGMPVGTTGQTLINTNGTWSANNNLFHNGINVGIGNAAPTAKLHVTGDVRITGNLSDRNNEFGLAGQVLSTTGAGLDWVSIIGLPSGSMGQTLYHNGSNWLSGINLYNNGTNVGIGTEVPSSKLHVNGDVRINGALRDSNNDSGVTDMVMTSTGTGTDWKDVCTIVSECEGIGPGIGGWGYDSVAVSGTNGESTYLYSANSIVANISDVSGSMVFSAKGVGYNGNVADATRLTYMPSMAAFRAGSDDQGNWNPENQGYGSAAFGRNTVAVGDYTVASGFETRAEGFGSVAYGHTTRALGGQSAAFGYQTQAYGDGAFVAGTLGTAEGSGSAVFGYENYGAGAFSFAAGQGNMALTYAETVLGYYATQQEGSLYSPQSTDRVFAIGNGMAGERSNALVVLKNGNTGIGANSPQFKLVVAGDATMNGVRVGMGAGSNSTNTLLGNGSFSGNASGSYNSTMGFTTLNNNTTGSYNVALGSSALPANTSGSYNNGVGFWSMYYNTTGSYNNAFGYSAGDYTYAPSNSTFYGSFANTNTTSGLSNMTAIGYDSKATASNQVRIGSSSVTSIGGTVQWTTVSDKRFKSNVQENVKGLDFIMKLKPVTYNLDVNRMAEFLGEGKDRDSTGKIFTRTSALDSEARAQKEQIRYTGFLAQDVEQAAKEAGYEFSGVDAPQNDKSIYGLRYAEFTVPLVKAVQELNAKVDATSPVDMATKAELDVAKAEIAELRSLVNKLIENHRQFEGDLQQCCFEHGNANNAMNASQPIAADAPQLEQNQPNPFHENTTIRYYLPNSTQSANITIADLDGMILKSFDLSGSRGAGQVLISGGAFAAGTYVYTLTVNGKLVDSKRMVLM